MQSSPQRPGLANRKRPVNPYDGLAEQASPEQGVGPGEGEASETLLNE